MSATITLNIPLKSFLKKYLTHKYGEEHDISRRTWFGRYIIDILDKNYKKSNVDIKKDSFYPVHVSSCIIKEVGFDISATKLKLLSEMIYKVFLNDLYSYIEVSIGNNLSFFNEKHESINKQNVLQAISQFLKFYDINESELSPDSVYRNFYRERKSDKKEKKKKATAL